MRNRFAGLILSAIVIVQLLGVLPSTGSQQIDSLRPTSVEAQTNNCTSAWGYQVCASDYIAGVIYGYGGAYAGTIFQLAACESGFNPNAQNARGDTGLLQFQPSTFYAYGGSNVWSPEEQVSVAAYMLSLGLGFHWVTYGGC